MREGANLLPDPSVITELAKTADKIFISSQGRCGGKDFRCAHLKGVRLQDGKGEGYRVERSRYAYRNIRHGVPPIAATTTQAYLKLFGQRYALTRMSGRQPLAPRSTQDFLIDSREKACLSWNPIYSQTRREAGTESHGSCI
jgi:hypothetical protein